MIFVLACIRLATADPAWWLALKAPSAVDPLSYDYADSKNPWLVRAQNSILDQLREVMSHYYSAMTCVGCGIGLLEWNDQEPRRRKRNGVPIRAHAKGFLVVHTSGAYLLTHSAPRFPTPHANLDHFYSDNAFAKAQHFFYAELSKDAVEPFAKEVLLYLWPKVQNARMDDPDGELRKLYPTLTEIILNYRSVNWESFAMISEVVLPLSDGTELVVVTKPAGHVVSIYEEVSVRTGPILAQTWLPGIAKEPSSLNVRRVCHIKNAGADSWFTTHDHSKYFVSKDARNHFVGIGDLNRQFTQWYRGGSLFILDNQYLSQSVRERMLRYDQTCAEAKHVCTPPMVRDARKDNDVCTSSADQECKCKDFECCKEFDIDSSFGIPISVGLACLLSLTSNVRGPRRSLTPTEGVWVSGVDGLKCVRGVDGVWSSWTTGSCSKPCGGGIHTRTRTCMPLNGSGAVCSGPTTNSAPCNEGDCGNCMDSSGACKHCRPPGDDTFSCLNGRRCRRQGCCNSRGGVEICPANLPFLCERASTCSATSAGCAFDGGAKRSSCNCFDDDGGLQAEPGWSDYTCQRSSRFYCADYAELMAKHCPLSCHLCPCQDNDAGLQSGFGWSRYDCVDSAEYCQGYAHVRKHCRKSCHTCSCRDDNTGALQSLWGSDVSRLPSLIGVEIYTCASSLKYCIPYAKIMSRLCPETCHLCDCQDDDGGLASEKNWAGYTCASSTRYCSSYANIMQVYCRTSCELCDSPPAIIHGGLRKKRSAVAEKCPMESNCAEVSSPNAPCAVVVGDVSWTAWDEVHGVWVQDHCVLHAYTQRDFRGAYQEFYPGSHAFEPRALRSVKCACGVCAYAQLPNNVAVSNSSQSMAINGFHVALECAPGYVLVGSQPRATVCDLDGTPYSIEHAEGCAPLHGA